MNIARLPKADDRSGFFKAVTGSSTVWQVAEPQRPESTFRQHQSPTVSAQLEVKNQHRKSPTEGVLWIDMITNALIVIIMALASYVFISAKTLRTHIEPAVISYSEPLQPR
jgi:hypothetical protein